MARRFAASSQIYTIFLAVLLGMACVGTSSAQDSGARIRLLEEKLIQSSPGSLPAVSYSVRDIGRIAGAVRLALPEAGGHALALTGAGKVWAETSLALAASTTTLGSAPNPAAFGAPVTLTATVSPGAATGQVTFYDGTTVLGVSTLAGGTATLATSLLPAGSRSLRAFYVGDATYAASTSTSVAQTVDAQPANGFLAAVNYMQGQNADSVTVGDFNGDGKADLAVSISFMTSAGSVGILLGNGDGTFPAAVNYGVGSGPQSVAIGDFNGDGKADLAVVNYYGNNVSVLLGNGNGTFHTAVNYGAGREPTSAAVGDFNGDGKADLAVASRHDDTVSVLLGNGNGTFQSRVTYGAEQPSSVAVGDFNGDGKADLAVTNATSGNVSVLLGDGDGTFQAAVSYAAGAEPLGITVGDLNGDGKADLAVAGSGGVSVLLGNGNGTFQTAVNYGVGSGARSVAVGDFNGDGKADLAAGVWLGSATASRVGLLPGNGNGTFQAVVSYAVGIGAGSVAVGEFNGDGRTDLAVANVTSANLSVLLGASLPPAGSPSTTTLVASPNPSTFGQLVTLTATVSPAAATGRVTFYDGTTVLGVGTLTSGTATLTTSLLPAGSPNLRAYYAGDANYLASTSVSVTQTVNAQPATSFLAAVGYGAGTGPWSVAVGDFNSDGKIDLAVTSYYSSAVSVLLGNGNGSFQAAVNYEVGVWPQSVAIGDFNGDGKADLAVADFSGLSVLLGNGNGTFQTAVTYGTPGGPLSIAVGDFNGDGKADLAVSCYFDLCVLLGSGTGSFQTAVTYDAGNGPGSVAVGDFNGDGKADLAVVYNGGLSVLLGNGDGTFQAAVNYGAGSGPQSVTTGDFNGDGRADLAVANSNGNNVSVLLGNGNGTFQTAMNYGAGSTPTSIATGDINGDGKPDLAVANQDNNSVSVMLGNGNGTFQAAVNYGAGAGPRSLVVGELNGDGKTDLAVGSGGSNNVSVLLGTWVPRAPTATTTALVSAPNPSTFGQVVTLTATISPATATGQVTFYGPTTMLGVGTLTGGTATLTTSLLPIGSQLLQAHYDGDANYLASTSAWVTQTVSVLTPTATSLVATPNPSLPGQAVALTATVSPSAATGQVTFYDGSTVLGVRNLTSGTAMLATTQLPVGDRSLRASYGGDTNYQASTSSWVTQTVSVSTTTTTTLAATPNPSALGQLVTLTATVSPSAAAGQVTFLDGATVLGVGTLAGGTATLATSSLPVGNRSLRAYYGGDAFYLPSTSGWVTQTTDPAMPGLHYLGSLAQLASGGHWKTTITLVNHGTAAARARVNFFDNSGQPLPLPISYPSLPPADPVSLTSVERTLEPGASFSFFTTGPDAEEPLTGWAQMLTDGDISGFAVFRQKVNREQEAVVPLETHDTDSYVLWFNNSGNFASGVAIANGANQPASVQVIMRDEAGAIFDTQTIPLAALGHTSFSLAEQFPQTSQRVGSLEFQTPPGGEISVLGLRFNGISFTTVPVLDRAVQTASTPLSALIAAGSAAQLASGNYWQTTITLVNKGNFSARTKLDFFDNQGNPLVLPITFPATPGVPAVMISTLERTLAPGASLSLSAGGLETVGWTRLSTDGDVGGFAIFRQDVDGAQEALAPMEIGNPDSCLLWFDNTGTFASGVAVVNNAGTPASVQVVVRNEAGAQIHSQPLELLAGQGHTSFALSSLIADTGGKVGSVEFLTPPGGAITVLGLRFNGVSFTTIPVMPVYR